MHLLKNSSQNCYRTRWNRLFLSGSLWLGLIGLSASGCLGFGAPLYEGFGNPERVQIEGYSGVIMEPFISPDGAHLFYNNSNAAEVNTQLRYAERVDGLHFRDRGELNGANSEKLDAVASVDREGRFYFVSMRSYDDSLQSLYQGRFADDSLSELSPVEGISRLEYGYINFDAEISADGKWLFYVDGKFGLSPLPEKADILIAQRNSETGIFTPVANAAEIMAAVNSGDLEYAPCISADGLELFFTRSAWLQTQIYRTTRKNMNAPFDEPQRVHNIPDGTEAPTLSANGLSLYYHQSEDDGFVLYRVQR